jgi:hypothetical protein
MQWNSFNMTAIVVFLLSYALLVMSVPTANQQGGSLVERSSPRYVFAHFMVRRMIDFRHFHLAYWFDSYSLWK